MQINKKLFSNLWLISERLILRLISDYNMIAVYDCIQLWMLLHHEYDMKAILQSKWFWFSQVEADLYYLIFHHSLYFIPADYNCITVFDEITLTKVELLVINTHVGGNAEHIIMDTSGRFVSIKDHTCSYITIVIMHLMLTMQYAAWNLSFYVLITNIMLDKCIRKIKYKL